MSTYRKIEAEVRDEDTSTTISYSKNRKEGTVTEKVFIKKKKDRKTVSEVRGTSVDGEDWAIKGEDAPVNYKKYTPDSLFKEFGFIDLDSKKIGGGSEFLGIAWMGWLVVLCIVLALWFMYEYNLVTSQVGIENAEKELWNNSKPAPTTPKELEIMDFWQTTDRAKAEMWKRVGMGA